MLKLSGRQNDGEKTADKAGEKLEQCEEDLGLKGCEWFVLLLCRISPAIGPIPLLINKKLK